MVFAGTRDLIFGHLSLQNADGIRKGAKTRVGGGDLFRPTRSPPLRLSSAAEVVETFPEFAGDGGERGARRPVGRGTQEGFGKMILPRCLRPK